MQQPSSSSSSSSSCFFPFLFFPSAVSVAESKMVRAALVTATSLALTGAVVAHAYLLKHQFYPTVVYLTKSSPSMAVRAVQSQILEFGLNNLNILPISISFEFDNMSSEPTSVTLWQTHFWFLFLFLVSGVVHSGLCVGVSAGKIHEEGVFWTTKGCRNGGRSLFMAPLTHHNTH